MYDNFYSHLVNWLKVLLPLTALGILSTLFLLSRGVDTSGAIPYADVDVEGLAREQRITEPQFSGVAEDGAAIVIRAERARPDLGALNRVTADAVDAHVDLTDGEEVDITAPRGIIDSGAGRLDLSGGTLLTYSAGYVIETEGLTAWLETGHMETSGPVLGTAPMGRIEAGLMTIAPSGEPGSPPVLAFTDGVKLIYDP